MTWATVALGRRNVKLLFLHILPLSSVHHHQSPVWFLWLICLYLPQVYQVCPKIPAIPYTHTEIESNEHDFRVPVYSFKGNFMESFILCRMWYRMVAIIMNICVPGLIFHDSRPWKNGHHESWPFFTLAMTICRYEWVNASTFLQPWSDLYCGKTWPLVQVILRPNFWCIQQ
jgi:hypothetical protein